MKIRKGFLIVFFSIFISVIHTYCQDNATEFGVADDLIVLGVSGTYDDPDVEIKGFTVFGTTQSAYTANIPYGPGNVIINGVLGVSSGAYIAGTSTFSYVSSITISGAGAIFINNGSVGQILRKKSSGELEWVDTNILGDNLGNHIATMTITANYGITASTISVSTLTANLINVSTVNATGYISADNYINAQRYLINNSTMVVILPGTDSIAYGVYAGTSNLSTGDYNLFVGNYAGTSNTDGDYNVFIGPYAGYSNTTGNSNTTNGVAALYSNTTGEKNIASGYKAAYYTQTGSSNTVIGSEAGYGVIGNSYSLNSILGFQAGYSLTTGSTNTLLGAYAGSNITSGGNNIIIGANVNAPSPTANNQLNIGNLIYGDMTVGSQKVGIATNTPVGLFQVGGGSLTVLANGNVGIGTTNPSEKLHIQDGKIRIVDGTQGAGKVLTSDENGVGSWQTITVSGDNLGSHVATMTITANYGIDVSSINITGVGVGGSSELLKIAGSTMVVLNNGNVGIGTTAPQAKLEVAGQVKITGGNPGAGKVLTSDASGLASWQNPPAGGVPSGVIVMYSGPWNFDETGLGTGPLTGWALCNGNNGTPNLSDRFVMGTVTSGNLGSTGGANFYSLTTSQLPSHTHTIATDGQHTHNILFGDPGVFSDCLG